MMSPEDRLIVRLEDEIGTLWAERNALEAIVTILTRERDAAVQDAARLCQWREDDPDFETWRTGCGHLWSFNAGGPEENGTKFCQYCGGALDAAHTADATPSFAESLIGFHEATPCDGCGELRCRCARTADAEVQP